MAEAATPTVKPWCKDDKERLLRHINNGRINITRTNNTQYVDRVQHCHFRERDPVNFHPNFRTFARSIEIQEHYTGYCARLAAGGIVFCPSSSYFNDYLTLVLPSL